MKHFLVVMLFCMANIHCLKSESPQEIRDQMKFEYCGIVDRLFITMQQAQEQQQSILEQEHFLALYNNHVTALQNFMSDVNIAVSFNGKKRKKVSDQLHECLKNKVHEQAQLLFESNGVSLTKADDFLCLSKIVCGLTQGQDGMCTRMVNDVRKDWAVMLKKLDIIEQTQAQVDAKIRRLDEVEDKKIQREQLYKNIMLGTHQHKDT